MQLNNVTLAYGEKVVASGINASLTPGELVCLIGRNGAGKSTLIRYILNNNGGLLDDCSQDKETPVSHLISVVLTDRIDVDHMKAEEVVAMGRAPYTGFFGVLSAADKEIVAHSMEQLNITDLAPRYINTLSDGERQKVMIAKALAQQTPYILLDEPTAFLDYPTKVETMKMLLHLCKEQGKAILISTHDLDIALRYCTKVWHIKNHLLTETTSFDIKDI